MAYAPGGPYQREWAQLAVAESPREFCEGYRVNVCPPTDDKPFFFNMTRIGDILDRVDGMPCRDRPTACC